MKVKFPILIKGVHQFNTLMDFLKEHNVIWTDGDETTHYDDFCESEGFVDLPIYILYKPPAASIYGCGTIYYREFYEDWVGKEVEVEL